MSVFSSYPQRLTCHFNSEPVYVSSLQLECSDHLNSTPSSHKRQDGIRLSNELPPVDQNSSCFLPLPPSMKPTSITMDRHMVEG